jgi:predicted RNase H-like HicB family nuclease
MDVVYRAVVRPAVEVVVEGEEPNWSAYCPAIPGAIGVGKTLAEVLRSVETSLEIVLEEMQKCEEAAMAAEDAARGAG